MSGGGGVDGGAVDVAQCFCNQLSLEISITPLFCLSFHIHLSLESELCSLHDRLLLFNASLLPCAGANHMNYVVQYVCFFSISTVNIVNLCFDFFLMFFDRNVCKMQSIGMVTGQ